MAYMFFAGFTNDPVNYNVGVPGAGLRTFIKAGTTGTYAFGEGLLVDTPNYPNWGGPTTPLVDGLPPGKTMINATSGGGTQIYDGPLANVGGTTRAVNDTNYPTGKYFSIGAVDVEAFNDNGAKTIGGTSTDFSDAVSGGYYTVGATYQDIQPGQQLNDPDVYNLCTVSNQLRGQTNPDDHGTRAIFNIQVGDLANFFMTALDKSTVSAGVWGRPQILQGYTALTTSDADEKAAACLLGCGYGLMLNGQPAFCTLS